MNPKPAATQADLERIRDLAADLSSAMGRLHLAGSGLDPADWYAVNRVVRAANDEYERGLRAQAAQDIEETPLPKGGRPKPYQQGYQAGYKAGVRR